MVSRLPLTNLFNSKPSIEKGRGSLQTQKTSRKDPHCHISMLMRCHSETRSVGGGGPPNILPSFFPLSSPFYAKIFLSVSKHRCREASSVFDGSVNLFIAWNTYTIHRARQTRLALRPRSEDSFIKRLGWVNNIRPVQYYIFIK